MSSIEKNNCHHTIKGSSDKVDLYIKKSDELNINLNAIDAYGQTGYHYACKSDKKENFEVFKKILDNAEAYNIDLNALNVEGKTGDQVARGGFKKMINQALWLSSYFNAKKNKTKMTFSLNSLCITDNQ